MSVDSRKEAQNRLRWHEIAKRVLLGCGCAPDYKARNMVDPTCMWHECKDDLIEALSAEYLQGRADQRYEWMSRIAGRHGDG